MINRLTITAAAFALLIAVGLRCDPTAAQSITTLPDYTQERREGAGLLDYYQERDLLTLHCIYAEMAEIDAEWLGIVDGYLYHPEASGMLQEMIGWLERRAADQHSRCDKFSEVYGDLRAWRLERQGGG